jgi:hypothetical protein
LVAKAARLLNYYYFLYVIYFLPLALVAIIFLF